MKFLSANANNSANQRGGRSGKSMDTLIFSIAGLMFVIWLLGNVLVSFIPAEHIANRKAQDKKQSTNLTNVASQSKEPAAENPISKVAATDDKVAATDEEATPTTSDSDLDTEANLAGVGSDFESNSNGSASSNKVTVSKPAFESDFTGLNADEKLGDEDGIANAETPAEDSVDDYLSDPPALTSTTEMESKGEVDSSPASESDSNFLTPDTNQIDFTKSTDTPKLNASDYLLTPKSTPQETVADPTTGATTDPSETSVNSPIVTNGKKAQLPELTAADLYTLREWKSNTGGTATMAFERWDGDDHVVFRNEKKQRFRVPILRLSDQGKAILLQVKKSKQPK
jgi:hypothetical protein